MLEEKMNVTGVMRYDQKFDATTTEAAAYLRIGSLEQLSKNRTIRLFRLWITQSL